MGCAGRGVRDALMGVEEGYEVWVEGCGVCREGWRGVGCGQGADFPEYCFGCKEKCAARYAQSVHAILSTKYEFRPGEEI